MSERSAIRGMAWDHPRGRDPLAAISTMWSAECGIPVHWDARPLKDFEDQPLEELATDYDLVLIDHPFTGTAAQSGLIVPVDAWVDADYLEDQRRHSAGPSFASYTWNRQQWALAIDAACQVAAFREDLLKAYGQAGSPATWDQVQQLAVDLLGQASRVAVPLNPNHAYCAFLSVGVGLAGPAFWPTGGQIDRRAAKESLDFLSSLTRLLHPLSRVADPIAISDRMSTGDEIAYVPLMFGYSNYAREGFRTHPLRFANAPRGPSSHIGSVLGGVGLALSARSPRREAAADLARRIGASEVQSGLYFEAGGQPGHAAAWDSPAVNTRVGGFFTATRDTMEQAFMRPRVPGHRRFQVEAGLLIHDCLWREGSETATCADGCRDLVNQLLTGDS